MSLAPDDPDPVRDTPEAIAYRQAYARSNHLPPPAESFERYERRERHGDTPFDPEATVRMEHLVAEVKSAVEAADKAAQAAAALAKRQKVRQPRRPLAWSAALVLVVLVLCALAGWVAWLYLTHGGH